MKLYDNDSHHDTFTELVYDLLSDDPTWDRANQIIESFDSAPAVEVSDTIINKPGIYVKTQMEVMPGSCTECKMGERSVT